MLFLAPSSDSDAVSARLVNLLSKLRSSMWLIPGLMVLAAVLAALGLASLDARVPVSPWLARIVYSGGAPGARAVLASIAGSMIGVTGVTFSITIVALSLASSQFGPRLLRNFMRDRANQFVLGTFIATFAFCLLALRSIRETEAEGAYVIVIVGVLLALLSLGVLIFFIHHIATSIQADTVIANVARELSHTIEKLYPESMGDPAQAEAIIGGAAAIQREAPTEVRAVKSGYVQAIDAVALMKRAVKHDLVIRLDCRPGDFVIQGRAIMTLWSSETPDADLRRELVGTVILGGRRTAEQDVEFLIDQLVEVAVRSLSPGINDPFTAISCIDRLGAALTALGSRRMPSRYRQDEEGNLRVIADVSTFAGMMDAAFLQIRQYGRGSVAVTIRLFETFEAVGRAAGKDADRLRIVREHADRVLRTSRLVEHESRDLEEIHMRHARVLAALG